MGIALGGLVAALLSPGSAAYAQDKTFTMKLSTATINDTQHEWLKRFAALVEKDSGGRIKAEIYPASQLGSIPRQIEGVQFGSIQGWMGPPEFLVGVDERFEVLSAPGLFSSNEQVMKVMADPPIRKMIYELGEPKGLTGIGFAPIGPSSILTRKPVKTLADMKGMKIRVLASPFQLELIRRMDMSPIAMTLADVLPGLQQGTIDGTLTTMTICSPDRSVAPTNWLTSSRKRLSLAWNWTACRLPGTVVSEVRDGTHNRPARACSIALIRSRWARDFST